VVSSDQMTLLQWCMNMYKGICSFPISQKINKLSLGFALDISMVCGRFCFEGVSVELENKKALV
jgi:hypothetical protein